MRGQNKDFHIETVLMRGNNIGFHWEIGNIVSDYPQILYLKLYNQLLQLCMPHTVWCDSEIRPVLVPVR